ncbi:MAG: DNA topoisomerase-3 [Myxococcota bacterium]|jgi:DNA topoisomerase-3
MQLVITEKPSVARDIARVLGVRGNGNGFIDGDGIRITWCIGHLVELQEPAHYNPDWKRWSLDTLPMVPESFALRPRKDGAADQWKVVKRLLSDHTVTSVVNACDAGREGELIFRYAYQLAGGTAPVKRLWVSSMTDVAIRQAWNNLRDGAQYDTLAEAARCRSEADWLVGLNATRAMTCLGRKGGGDELLSIGRVQTPTLAMIVDRDLAIDAFVPETFWQVRADFTSGEAQWTGTWFGPDIRAENERFEDTPRAERLSEEAHAKAIADAVRGQDGVVETASSRKKIEPPPLLYDLTSLQRRANQRYGMTAEQTLNTAQALYERHKLLTYPRTDARFLTPDQVDTLPGIVEALQTLPPYASFAAGILQKPIRPGKRVVDAAEVGDHHAILPTDRKPSPGRLSPDEKRIYDLVARRLLAALSPAAELQLTELVVAVPVQSLPEPLPTPPRFRATGRILAVAGWRAVDPPGREKDRLLPPVARGASAKTEKSDIHVGQTKPPRPHNDASILRGMETAGKTLDDKELARAMRSAGLGTPATRAAILKTLIQRSYIVRQGKHVHATKKGRLLIAAVPVDELKSAELTGRWEKRLTDIAEGRETAEVFMRDAVARLREVIDAIAAADPPPMPAAKKPTGPVLGKCPVCDTPVRELRGTYSCETGRNCAFVVFKKMTGRVISVRMVKTLLKHRKTPIVKGWKSKAGNQFEAGLEIRDDGTVGLHFAPRTESSSTPRTVPAVPPGPSTDPVGMTCPKCRQGRIVKGRAAWGCNRYRQGCHFIIEFDREGRSVSAADAAARILHWQSS